MAKPTITHNSTSKVCTSQLFFLVGVSLMLTETTKMYVNNCHCWNNRELLSFSNILCRIASIFLSGSVAVKMYCMASYSSLCSILLFCSVLLDRPTRGKKRRWRPRQSMWRSQRTVWKNEDHSGRATSQQLLKTFTGFKVKSSVAESTILDLCDALKALTLS